MAESLKFDFDKMNIRIQVVNPGFVDTPLIADHERGALLFLLTAPEAVRRIARAIERGRAEYWFPRRMWLMARVVRALPGNGFEIAFPRGMTWLMKALRLLPYRLYFPLVGRLLRS